MNEDELEFEIKKHPDILDVFAAYESKKAVEKPDYYVIEEQLTNWSEPRILKLEEYSANK